MIISTCCNGDFLFHVIRMCLNETYVKFRTRKHLTDVFSQKGIYKDLFYRHSISALL